MPVSFVLIKAAAANEHDVYRDLLKSVEVLEVHPLFGDYDFIAKIDALGHTVMTQIRSIRGVAETKTLAATKF